MHGVIRSLGEENGATRTTTFTKQQNQAVLIAGLACACFSVLATLITLRWFILMKRTFRHNLIMFLILSDTFKALWYFLFPVVVLSRGPVASSSGFCQATGFFLAVGIESSDFAILMIALHAILYIFHPPARSEDSGGLYRWRKFIYPAWVALPVLAASLAFINSGDAYTTAGTFCYLPRRPFWYRLALSWIPRYCILSLIFLMYASLYIYVTLRFRSFSNLQDSDSNYSTHSHSRPSSRRSSMSEDGIAPDELDRPAETPQMSMFKQPTFLRASSYTKENAQAPVDPWDEVSFITSKPLRDATLWRPGVQASDFAVNAGNPNHSVATSPPQNRNAYDQYDSLSPDTRKVSSCPTINSGYTGDTVTNSLPPDAHPLEVARTARKVPPIPEQPAQEEDQDPLRHTRKAIRKQLRYMFIYPAVYVLMWAFPFASHCLLYNDYYVTHPIYWLTIISTCMFSLQAGVDCMVFSWREKPWRRIPEGHRFSIEGLRASFHGRHDQTPNRPANNSVAMGSDMEGGVDGNTPGGLVSGVSSRAPSALWWEAEGKRRKDSVWMGTDTSGDASHSSARRGTLIPPPIIEVTGAECSLAVMHEKRRTTAAQE